MTGKQMKKLFEENRWELDRIKGSHHIMRKGEHTESIPVHGSRELKKGMEKALLKRLKEVD
ncbi:MAG: type II toxin-antitoxin system HicA family toxin [Candidatus Eremiobacteraeota bacterium]|nr:type II toxin-antitoxin system HicA family toxin [Candidatus Eremiobacteraeota bacterium]